MYARCVAAHEIPPAVHQEHCVTIVPAVSQALHIARETAKIKISLTFLFFFPLFLTTYSINRKGAPNKAKRPTPPPSPSEPFEGPTPGGG